MKHHQHKANMTKREIRGWTNCVAYREHGATACDGRAHGGIIYRDHCSCGAERMTEANGRDRQYGPWTEKDER